MLIITTERIEGKKYEIVGLVKGSVVRTKDFSKDFMAGLKNLVGGEIESYTKMMDEAREIATNRMIEDANRKKADAIIGARYASSAIMGGAAEVMAYGTAIKFIDEK